MHAITGVLLLSIGLLLGRPMKLVYLPFNQLAQYAGRVS